MNVYMHAKKEIKENVIIYILALIPLYLYGIYKNGVLLYTKNLINFISIFKLPFLALIGIIAYFLCCKVFRKKMQIDFYLLSLFIIPLFMPYSINFILYIIAIIIGSIIYLSFKNIDLPNIALTISFITLALHLFSHLSFLNPAESLNIYAFNSLDLLFGRNIGGLGSTLIIYGIILTILLSTKTCYKTSISVSGLIIYVVLAILFHDLNFLYNGNAIFALIIIMPWNSTSPLLKKNRIIYGLITSTVGFFLTKYISFYTGMIISVTIFSLIYALLNNIFIKKSLKM